MNPAIENSRERALRLLIGKRAVPTPRGITSVCSAHPMVIEAALRRGLAEDMPVLIEATCNQVNHEGGYTGMTPADFRRFVEAIAERVGFPLDHLILGGDHLGPNPWKTLPADAALRRAEVMIAAFVVAGFEKIHLDTSMGCAGEPAALSDALTAMRAARLASIAESQAAAAEKRPVYIIGTEVPPPGGATHVLGRIALTEPAAPGQTLEIHRAAFAEAGVEDAMERVIGIVVQPGVEFGNANVALYQPERAHSLSESLTGMPGLIFEAHSTDYQPASALRALVDDGFAILKVGPGLTFALREALYGLDAIAAEFAGRPLDDSVERTMEQVMRDVPRHWQSHYPGNAEEQRLQRHFSYSDRIRYYWPEPRAAASVERLFTRLGDRDIPETLVSQYLGRLHSQVVAAKLVPKARNLCLAAIDAALEPYVIATVSTDPATA
jgi:D-tagatose-1,6-bisphosphate aldolase subunit GatZ/KbaZ